MEWSVQEIVLLLNPQIFFQNQNKLLCVAGVGKTFSHLSQACYLIKCM